MPRAAVLGSPVQHSLSPVLHRAAYEALGLSGWHYVAIECDETALPGMLDGLGEDWVGLSLTMPLKRAVMPLLDEVSELATRVGAVNTVTLSPGHRRGENTDVLGLAAAVREGGCPAPGESGAPVVVLGGGATAGSALAALAGMGAQDVTMCVRSSERARPALRVAETYGLEVDVRPWPQADDLVGALGAGGLVVSTVPAGAADGLADGLSRASATDQRPAGGLLLDVVYSPWPTALARAWQGRGGRVVGGVAMLVHQAAGQVELFTGRTPPVDAMRAAVDHATDGI